MLYTYLTSVYKNGEPIFLTDITIDGMAEENLRYHLKRLTDQGHIRRFDAGVYYLPKKNLLGEEIALSAETVAIHKYIKRQGRHIGYYSGFTLANRMGLSGQVPFKEEIVSNNAPAQIREVAIGNRKYVIRRPVTQITEENVYVLQFLDCLKDMNKISELEPRDCGSILSRYAREHNITKELVDRYISYYPLKVYKAIYDTEVQYASA